MPPIAVIRVAIAVIIPGKVVKNEERAVQSDPLPGPEFPGLAIATLQGCVISRIQRYERNLRVSLVAAHVFFVASRSFSMFFSSRRSNTRLDLASRTMLARPVAGVLRCSVVAKIRQLIFS